MRMTLKMFEVDLPDEKHSKGEETEQGDCVRGEETRPTLTWHGIMTLSGKPDLDNQMRSGGILI